MQHYQNLKDYLAFALYFIKPSSLEIERSKILGQEVKGIILNKRRGLCRGQHLVLPKGLYLYHKNTCTPKI